MNTGQKHGGDMINFAATVQIQLQGQPLGYNTWVRNAWAENNETHSFKVTHHHYIRLGALQWLAGSGNSGLMFRLPPNLYCWKKDMRNNVWLACHSTVPSLISHFFLLYSNKKVKRTVLSSCVITLFHSLILWNLVNTIKTFTETSVVIFVSNNLRQFLLLVSCELGLFTLFWLSAHLILGKHSDISFCLQVWSQDGRMELVWEHKLPAREVGRKEPDLMCCELIRFVWGTVLWWGN